MHWFRRSLLALGALAVIGSVVAPRPAFADNVLVFAAASLRNALDDAAHAYEKKTGTTI